MFGINGGELIVILVVAVVVVGPERLPKYAEQLGILVRRARALLTDVREKVSEELGPEVADVDWAQLDPRRYDPRRIVRDALLDDTIFDARKQTAVKVADAGASPTGTPDRPAPTLSTADSPKPTVSPSPKVAPTHKAEAT